MHEVLYSDGSSESLDDVVTQDYNLVAESTNNRVAAVSIKAQNSIELLGMSIIFSQQRSLGISGQTPTLSCSSVTFTIL